jgi:cytochrome d ubiquinol oxidase subunit II
VTPLELQTVWFVLVGVLLAGYAVLDGFDLGVGILHLLHPDDESRRISLNAIGPVWDGNEVWLVTAGGALFAAFPEVYATVFSGFYLAMYLLLAALIFRAVAIEFRSKREERWWRATWDVAFSVASGLAAVLIGVALGNVARGVPLGADHEYAGTFLDLLNPYALLLGGVVLALFAMHGALYLLLKTDGAVHARVRTWVRPTVIGFVVAWVVFTLATLLYVPHLTERIRTDPRGFAFLVATVLAVADIPREIHLGRDGRAFAASCAVMALQMGLLGLGMYPYLVWSLPDPAFGLTIERAASSPTTLTIMLVVAAIGIPMVLGYTATIYWIFRGKVRLGSHSY